MCIHVHQRGLCAHPNAPMTSFNNVSILSAGLFAIYGAKPFRSSGAADNVCKGPLLFQQYMTQLATDNGDATTAVPSATAIAATAAGKSLWPAQAHIPLVIQPSAHASTTGNKAHIQDPPKNIKEKNWMPLTYGTTLYMVYSLHPTRIYQVHPSGKLTPAYITNSAFLLGHSHIPIRKVHGGPPIVLVPHLGRYKAGTNDTAALEQGAAAAALKQERYLGIMHYFDMESSPDMPNGEARKHYHHHFFYLHAAPPFHICQVSKELLLQEKQGASPAARHVQYASGLHYDVASRQVLVSYGTGDAAARVMVLALPELESMFMGQIEACAVANKQ